MKMEQNFKPFCSGPTSKKYYSPNVIISCVNIGINVANNCLLQLAKKLFCSNRGKLHSHCCLTPFHIFLNFWVMTLTIDPKSLETGL